MGRRKDVERLVVGEEEEENGWGLNMKSHRLLRPDVIYNHFTPSASGQQFTFT